MALIPSCVPCVKGICAVSLLDKNMHLFKYLLLLMAEQNDQEIRQMKKYVEVEGPEETQYVYEPQCCGYHTDWQPSSWNSFQ